MSERRRWRRGAAALGAVAAALAVVTGIGALDTVGSPPVAALAPPASALSPVPAASSPPTASTTTTTVSPAGAPTNLIRLPVPDYLPDDPYAPTPDAVVGHISIPAIGLDDDIHSGMTLTAINRGPSWWPGTALPGELGNVVIGGHRTTFSHPFRDLDQLAPGDEVVFTTAAGTFTYRVTRSDIVDPGDVQIADQAIDYTATLFACHPPGSARYRIVVQLHLVDGAGEPVAPPSGFTVANAADIVRYRS